MTTITITPTGIRETPCEIIDHHMFRMDCVMTIDGEITHAEWFECMDIITRMFPEVEFTEVWTGHTCTFTPTGRHVRIVPEAGTLFGEEVFE